MQKQMFESEVLYAMIHKDRGALSTLEQKVDSLSSGFNYIGSVDDISDLPASGTVGDQYTVLNDDNALYVWDGEQWVRLAPDLSVITDVIGNLFSDAEAMSGATGITRVNGSEYVGTASAFQTFLLNNYTLDPSADSYVIAFDIYTEANSSSSGTGLEVQYGNHSSKSTLASFDNDQTDPYHFESFFSVTYSPTAADKSLGLVFKANSATSNIWHVSNIRLVEGMEIPDGKTAKDVVARDKAKEANDAAVAARTNTQAMIAAVYDATKTYAVGDYVTYNNALYRCKTAISTAEAWTAAHWEAAKVGPDLKDLKSSIADTTDYALSAYATDTASGAIATFPDGAEDIPIKSLSVAIEPVQDLHGQDAPYPAGGGKNKFGPNTNPTLGYYVLASGDLAQFEGWNASDYIAVNPSTQYTVSMDTESGSAAKHAFYTAEKVAIPDASISSGGGTFTTPSNCSFMRFSYRTTTTWIQLELGSTATEYAPYSNICPISGHTSANVTRTGANLCDLADAGIGTKSLYNLSSGTITIGGSGATLSGTNPITITNTTTWRGAVFFSKPLKAGQQFRLRYRITGTSTSNIKRTVYLVDKSNAIISRVANSSGVDGDVNYVYSVLVTAISDGNKIVFAVESANQQTITIYDLSINYPATDTEYHTYQGTTYPITFPSGTTVYGGNITVNQDGSGSLVVDRPGVTFDGTQSNFAFAAGTTANRITWTGFNTIGVGGKPFISDTFKSDSYSSGLKTIPWLIYNAAADPRMNMSVPTTITSVADFVAYCAQNPVQVVYPLATPITIPLTAEQIGVITSLYGVNNFWADTGDVDVTIRADTALYIAKKIAEALA